LARAAAAADFYFAFRTLVTRAGTSEMEALEKRFLSEASRGIISTPEDLLAYGKKMKLSPLPSAASLSRMRERFPETAAFAHAAAPTTHMAPSFSRYGTVQIDLAMYGNDPRTRWHNGGCGSFILGVECISKCLFLQPVRDKTAATWQRAVQTMCETVYDGVTVVLADREAALTSPTFVAAVKKDFGVEIRYLKSRQGAHLAELYIRLAKDRLSISGQFNKRGDLNWTRAAASFVKDFNSRKVPGTNMVRSSINKNNYEALLSQLHGIRDPDVVANLGTRNALSPRVEKALFKLKVGDRVQLLRASNYQVGQTKASFEKASVTGSFGPRVYVVTKLVLRRGKDMTLCPVYQLAEKMGGKPLSSFYYEREVKRVLFTAP
jgi:hypothetical protein